MEESKKTVIIIGAGPAGITSAYELLKQSDEYQVIILEESYSIGGISRTVKHNGNRMDIGGHRFFSKNVEVMKWWENILPTQGKSSFDDLILKRKKKLPYNGPDPEKIDKVMLKRNRISRIFYKGKFFDYPISLKWETINNLGFFTTFKAGFSYLKTTFVKLKEDSLENFYINRFGKVLYSMFFEGYTEKLWGRPPKEISADWGAQRVKGLSIKAIIKDIFSKILCKLRDILSSKQNNKQSNKQNNKQSNRKVETSLIEEFYYPKLGPGQLWETAAEEFEKMGGEIKFGCNVTHIHRDTLGRISSLTYIENGKEKEIKGDMFISSMALKDLVVGMDNIPKDILKIAKGLPYRDFVTVGLLVNKLSIKNETNIRTLGNIVPDCWIYVQDSGVKLGRIQIFNNWSPYLVNDPLHQVWIGLEYFCNENDKLYHMSEEECVSYAANELVKMGIITSPGEILDFHREKVKKAYPAYFDTYSEINQIIDYLSNIENLYCVGRNGQHRYNNMDHSMVTAFETVKNIINSKKTKENIWNVNTEADYHEEKK